MDDAFVRCSSARTAGSETRPDVVVLDHTMPGTSGVEPAGNKTSVSELPAMIRARTDPLN